MELLLTGLASTPAVTSAAIGPPLISAFGGLDCAADTRNHSAVNGCGHEQTGHGKDKSELRVFASDL
ncbi:uncharacterized protein SETTUDRAFT_23281 [Exserohilum turcica Et28A]|uniref:Uncharacterized protein n=1 Tax=Exserohilum turcicum (strain 28A) TaxID=671987 RepID=R0JX13_EXST2|nr:uncharacterized protein SETTUDRAFT_23281 [Exserohilum turcica Et28A]EOA82029.1 hypothetical protein SETTUDRAFT_23281 [Exserohilum turcica Et28A]